MDSLIAVTKSSNQDSLSVLFITIAEVFSDSTLKLAFSYLDSAEYHAKLEQNDFTQLKTKYLRGKYFAIEGNYKKSLQQMEECLPLYNLESERHLKIKASQFLTTGWIKDKQGLLPEALENYNSSLKIFTRLNDEVGIPNAIINIGIIYDRLGQVSTAKRYYERSLKLYNESGNIGGLVYAYNNIANIQLNQKEYDEALKNFKKAFQYSKEVGMRKMSSTIFQNIGQIYINQGEYEKAIPYLEGSYEIDLTLNDQRSLMYAIAGLAQAKYFSNQEAPAFEKVINCYEYSIEHNDLHLQERTTDILAKMYERAGKFGSSLKYYKLSENYKDSLQNIDLNIKLNNAEVQRQIEELKFQNELQNEQKESQFEKEKERASLVRNILLIGLLFLVLIAYFTYLSFKKTRSLNQQLQQKNTSLLSSQIEIDSQNEELQKYIDLNIALEQFAHIVSHDIKAPLRTISSYIGLLRKSILSRITAKEEDYFKVILNSTKRLNVLVDDLLRYSKVDHETLDKRNFHLYDLIQEVVADIEFSIKSKQAIVVYNDTKIDVWGDRLKLKQVFQNILHNALKFSDSNRKCRINISTMILEYYTVISICDNGIGISETHKNKVFEKFAQLNSKDKYEGTGLGLSLCKQYVEKHGGRINIEPNEEYGITVSLTLPNLTT